MEGLHRTEIRDRDTALGCGGIGRDEGCEDPIHHGAELVEQCL